MVSAYLLSVLLVLALSWVAMSLSWLYFRRFKVMRPPIGVFNLIDVAYMMLSIVVVPYLYLLLPVWLVALLLGAAISSVLHLVWEPVLHTGLASWLITLLLVGGDIWASIQFSAGSPGFFAINNLVLVISIVGIANLWAQSGFRARDAALLGTFLAFYDLTATWLLPLTSDILARLSGLPFSPVIGWAVTGVGAAGTGWVGIGVGDLLMATSFPLVMRKGYGRVAGVVAMVAGFGAIAVIALLPTASLFPVMIVLGPLMLAQYLFWSRKQGRERTTVQYSQAEALDIANNARLS